MRRSNDNEDKLKGNRRAKRLPRVLVNAAIGVGLLLVLSLIVFAVFESGYLNTRKYTVQGNTFLTDEEVFEISRMEMGENLYSSNLGKTERYLENDPRISSAVVRRRFPDTVIIEIEEELPVAVVSINSGLYKVAGDGTIIAPLYGQYEDLPFLHGFAPEIADEEPVVGEKITGDGVGLGLEVASGLLSRPDFAVEVSSIRVNERIMLLGNDDAFVRYDAGFEKKHITRLALVWDVVSVDGTLYDIDLRYGNDVIIREL
ncbi:MAG: FtsQ-type POTRA domain-containing protein [bacterium]|nr:FtsQ-type POTRA domain-containing protein [bacterium]